MRYRKGLAAIVASAALAAAGAPGLAAADQGAGALTGHDALARTVSIDGRAYKVSETTRIVDQTGRRITLRQLPEPGSAGELFCEFETRGGREGSSLVSLRLVEIPE